MIGRSSHALRPGCVPAAPRAPRHARPSVTPQAPDPATAMLLPSLAAALILGVTPVREPAPAPGGYRPPALPLTGYQQSVCGRLTQEGTWDTGLVRVRFTTGTERAPLPVDGVDYATPAQFWAGFETQVGDLPLNAVVLGVALASGDDERLVVATQIKIENPTDTARKVVLGAELYPSHESPVVPSRPFDPASAWKRDGRNVVRDGLTVATWVGAEPELEVEESVDLPDATAARFTWRLEVPAGGSKLIELKTAGPPLADGVDDAAWRKRFNRQSYALLEEDLRWQGVERGTIAGVTFRTRGMERLLGHSVHWIRLLGRADEFRVERLSDVPYGRPATDAAIEAELLACLVESGMDEYCATALGRMIAEAPERAAELDVERRVAYLHALVRCIRLRPELPGAGTVAPLVAELGAADVAVLPWHHPDVVRRDLLGLLEALGMPTDGLLGGLREAETAPGSVAAHMQAARRAIAARSGLALWDELLALQEAADRQGMGSMDGGEMDGRFPAGVWTIFRAAFVDDHGDELHLMPGNSSGFVEPGTLLDTTWLPTRYGLVSCQAYYSGARQAGGWVKYRESIPPARMTYTLPDGVGIDRLRDGTSGGTAELVGDRLVEIAFDETGRGRGLRLSARVAKG